jgi:hypothetical protein
MAVDMEEDRSTGAGPSGRDLVCLWFPPSTVSLEGERCRFFRFGSDIVLLDGPEVGSPVVITGSPEGELVTDACGDPTESARGGSACTGSGRMSVVRDPRDIDLAGAFVSGFPLLSDVEGGVLGRGRAERALLRRFRFVSWAEISSSHAASLFWALVSGMVVVS